MRVIIYLFLIIITSSISNARDLSLETAIKLATDHSFELKKSKAESAAYLEKVKVNKSNRYPTLALNAYSLYNSETAQLNLELPDFSLNRDIGSNEVYQADLKLSVPIYTGGRISSGINLAQATYEMNLALESATLDRVKFLVKSEYLKLQLADLMIKAAQSSLNRIMIINKDIESAYSAGLADSLNIFEIKLILNDAELTHTQANTNRRYREIILLSMLGLSSDESLVLNNMVTEPKLGAVVFNGLAKSKNELVALSHAVEINRQIKKQYSASYKPALSLFGGYSYGKPNIDMFSGDANDNFTVGATLNWSFNLGGQTSSQTKMAQYQIEAAQNEYNKLNDELTYQAKTTLENLKLAYQSYRSKSKNYQIAQANYRLAKLKHNAGGLSSNRLLEIENDLGRSEANMLSSKVEYHIILAQYNYIIGSENNSEGL